MILRMIFLIFPKGVDGRLLRKIMAESTESTIDKALDKALERLNVSREKEKIILKREQETAVKELLAGRDVMAILPTGFGKSLIFTVFAIAKEQLRSEKTCVIVVSPLKSIIDDQIAEMASLDFTALELCGENLTSVLRDPPQFLYCTAENVLQTPFLGELKNSNTAIHKAVSAIVVDESHTVESWTGKR